LKRDASDVKNSVDENEELFSNFVNGSMVKVQTRYGQWWPAMVDYDPDTEEFLMEETGESTYAAGWYYHVSYGGIKVARNWVKCENVEGLDLHRY